MIPQVIFDWVTGLDMFMLLDIVLRVMVFPVWVLCLAKDDMGYSRRKYEKSLKDWEPGRDEDT